MTCPKCNYLVPQGKKLCRICGTASGSFGQQNQHSMSCPNCGRKKTPGMKYCGTCGTAAVSPYVPRNDMAPPRIQPQLPPVHPQPQKPHQHCQQPPRPEYRRRPETPRRSMYVKFVAMFAVFVSVFALVGVGIFFLVGDGGPSIVVHTTFEPGRTVINGIDIEFTATPGRDASIAEVMYSINDGAERFLYISTGNGLSPMGRLGQGRVLLRPGENHIVFTAKDTAGRTASFTVPVVPYFDFGTIPSYDPHTIVTSSLQPYTWFVYNRLVVSAHVGTTQQMVEQVVSTIGGEIVGQVNVLGKYWVEVQGRTEMELMELASRLEREHSNVVEIVGLDLIHEIEQNSTNDPWLDYIVTGSDWGIYAINAPKAWAEFGHLFRRVRIGILDTGIYYNHLDLRIPPSNVSNAYVDEMFHGTHVIGTIGAIHNNGFGLAGVKHMERDDLFGYDIMTSMRPDGRFGAALDIYLGGLAWLVTNGVQVVNASFGSDQIITCRYTSARQARDINRLLQDGHDFIITQSAGNGRWRNGQHEPISAFRSGAFRTVIDPVLMSRILVVGAVDSHRELAYFSNYGARVDVVAPGVDIFSTSTGIWNDRGHVRGHGSYFELMRGTSMAAPHAAGVAAMVWGANPGLTGPEVVRIIIDSAENSGFLVPDTRGNVPYESRAPSFLIDAHAAVAMALALVPQAPVPPDPGLPVPVPPDEDPDQDIAITDENLFGRWHRVRRTATEHTTGEYIFGYAPGDFLQDEYTDFFPDGTFVSVTWDFRLTITNYGIWSATDNELVMIYQRRVVESFVEGILDDEMEMHNFVEIFTYEIVQNELIRRRANEWWIKTIVSRRD